MISREQAKKLVESEFCRRTEWLPLDDEMIVVDEETIERPWGWIFFYTSRKWKETGDIRYAVAGNSPVMVEKTTGRLILAGTAHRIEHYIENFERTGNPDG